MDEKATKHLIVSSNEIWQMRGGIKEPAKAEQVTIDLHLQQYVLFQATKKREKTVYHG
jgi:N-acetylneuraminate synthase